MFSLRPALRASALVLALLVASCDTRSPDLLTAPDDVLTSKALRFVQAQPVGNGATRGRASSVLDLLGGTITAGGHSITVPPHAVSAVANFSLTVLDDEHVEVVLGAHDAVTGANVGAAGFANGKTVTLTLSYAQSVDITDPSRLGIVRHLADGTLETLPVTLDTASQTVRAQLGHFSKYAMITH
jgi:hypothetical protein